MAALNSDTKTWRGMARMRAKDIGMCGIIGYSGPRDASTVVMDGLSRLEYRGYDSAGIAILGNDGKPHVRRAVGKLSELAKILKTDPLIGNTGIGHTRWATHGRATVPNAHPHTSADGQIFILHNGIIENYAELRQKYLPKVKLQGETDTEIAANVIAKKLESSKTLHEAVRKSCAEFLGAYAFCVMSPKFPGEIVVARAGSPLILGLGKGENFVASDVPAILPYTKRVIYLDEGESAVVTAEAIVVYAADGKQRNVKPVTVDLSLDAAEKGGYPHFMLKEINEQPEAIANTLRGRIKKGAVDLAAELGLSKAKVGKFKQIHLIACGTSYYSALAARTAMQELIGVPVMCETASEYRYTNPVVDSKTLAIAISQSGETTDTKLAAELAKEHGATVIAVANVMGSSIPRMADATLYTRAGVEIGVASTKAYTTQITALLLLTVWLARQRESMNAKQEKAFVKEIAGIPEKAKALLSSKLVGVKRCAAFYQNVHNFMFIGRRYNFATAFEGALKLKEISYIHAEGYGAGEMKHGPIALVEGTFPTIVICPDSPYYAKTISNIREIKARDGVVVAVASEGDEGIKELADYLIYIPKTSEMLSPILAVIPLQLLAYYTAVNRGCDPDKPRNLAKAVTVE